jgi:GT2 family glycosyltransferase
MDNTLTPALPPVDVILLSWNRIELTLETVENLLQQKGVTLNIWIVDQGSTPENLAKLEEETQNFQNVYIKALGKNVGVPGGRNIGIGLGTAEYTISIDNDAVFESPDALSRVIGIFEAEPDVGVIGFRIINYFTNYDDEYSWSYPKPLKEKRGERFLATKFCGCGHAIRRSVFEQANGYDAELFFYWEETDFSYRVINLGYQIIYEPSIRVLHKVSPEARVRWQDKRFYYLVRNSIYMRLKYASNKLSVLIYVFGYLAKGTFNNLLPQTFQGIKDGLLMYQRLRSDLQNGSASLYSLTKEAKAYLDANDTRHRGSFLRQIKNGILDPLPGDDRLTEST